MNNQTHEPISRPPLRLWPAVLIVGVQWLLRFGVPLLGLDAEVVGIPLGLISVLAGPAGAAAIVVWWLLFSRAPWSERIGALAVMSVAAFAVRAVVHESIRGGMMGMMLFIYAIPTTLSLAFVVWAAASRRLRTGPRWAAMIVAIAIGCGVWTLARTNGVLGSGSDLAWRWTPTAEERLLARGDEPPSPGASAAPAAPSEPAAPSAPSAPAVPAPVEVPTTAKPEAPPTAKPAVRVKTVAPAEWPGFRGPHRDGVIRGVRIKTDWSAAPPVQMWRRPIGPGWSSFAVRGDLLYTQEQRGDDEIVACYRVSTGVPVWRHRDPVRFWESNGGAGPRATPTIQDDRVYAFGATGILNALDAASGKVAWSHNVASETGRKIPDWGFSSSPLVVGDAVVVAASGTLAAYDITSGNRRWIGPRQLGSYSSPHLATIGGVEQIVLLSGSGAAGFLPATGALLWEHSWSVGGPPIVQPALTDEGDILINTIVATGGVGTRRLAVAHGSSGWKVEERWTSNALKPYFNDFVVHKGHAFGFDGSILACIDLENGRRKWKGGRYGSGQLVLLADQDVLLVISEEGDVALVSATTEQFTEIARFTALNAKTWNHPVVVRDVLLVRNGEEMAAFRLPLEDR